MVAGRRCSGASLRTTEKPPPQSSTIENGMPVMRALACVIPFANCGRLLAGNQVPVVLVMTRLPVPVPVPVLATASSNETGSHDAARSRATACDEDVYVDIVPKAAETNPGVH
jgi:hypothetical protein